MPKNNKILAELKHHVTDFFEPLERYCWFTSLDPLQEPLWRHRQFALEDKETLTTLRRNYLALTQDKKRKEKGKKPAGTSHAKPITTHTNDWVFIAGLVLHTQGMMLSETGPTGASSSVSLSSNEATFSPEGFSQLPKAVQQQLLCLCETIPIGIPSTNSQQNRNAESDAQRIPELSNNDEMSTLSSYGLSILITCLLREGGSQKSYREQAIALLKGKKMVFKWNNNTFHLSLNHSLSLHDIYIELAHSNWHGLTLTGLDFSGQHLPYAKMNSTTTIGKLSFRYSCLAHANFAHSTLSGADLTGAECVHAVFNHVTAKKTIWTHANLLGARLKNMTAKEALFNQTNLYHSQLEHANLTNAHCKAAYFNDAKLHNTTFNQAKFSARTDLEEQMVFDVLKNDTLSLVSYLDKDCHDKNLSKKDYPQYDNIPKATTQETALAVQSHIIRLARTQGEMARSRLWPNEHAKWDVNWHHPTCLKTPLAKSTAIALDAENPLYRALSYFVHTSSEAKECLSGVSLTRLKHAFTGDKTKLFEHLWQEYHHRPGHENYLGRISIKKIEALHNPKTWKNYQQRKDAIKTLLKNSDNTNPLHKISWHIGGGTNELPVLDKEAGECWLFHAASSLDVMQSIIEHGFTTRFYSGSGKLGKGVYLTDAFGRSATYANWTIPCCALAANQETCNCPPEQQDTKVMFIVRAVLGRVHRQERKRDKKAEKLPEGFDAIWAPDGSLRECDTDFRCNEFIVNYTTQGVDEDAIKDEPVYQLYPEYVLYYHEHFLKSALEKRGPSYSHAVEKDEHLLSLSPTMTLHSDLLREACHRLYDYERLKGYATLWEQDLAKERFLSAWYRVSQVPAQWSQDESDLYKDVENYKNTLPKTKSELASDEKEDAYPHTILWCDSAVKLAQQRPSRPKDVILSDLLARQHWEEAAYWFEMQIYPFLNDLEKAAQLQRPTTLATARSWLASLSLHAGIGKYVIGDNILALRFINRAWLIAPAWVEKTLKHGILLNTTGQLEPAHPIDASSLFTQQTYYETSVSYLTQQHQERHAHGVWCHRIAIALANALIEALNLAAPASNVDVIAVYEKTWEQPIAAFTASDRAWCVKVLIAALDEKNENFASSPRSSNTAVTHHFPRDIVNLIIHRAQQLPDNTGVSHASEHMKHAWERQLIEHIVEPIDPAQNKSGKKVAPMGQVRWLNVKGECLEGQLKEAIANQLLKGANANPKPWHFAPDARGAITSGRRLVIGLKHHPEDKTPFAYAKAYPEYPGMQLAVDALLARLTGFSAVGTLCCFNLTGNDKESYPVYLSKSAGCALQDMEQNPQAWQQLEEQLDPYYFTLKVIATLLVGLEDDKKDNVCCEKNMLGNVQLTSIDADRAFVPDFTDKHKVNIKTVLFCFARMRTPLNPRAINRFLQLSPVATLESWLEHLIQLQTGIDILFDEAMQKKLLAGEENKLSIKWLIKNQESTSTFYSSPIITFVPAAIHRVYQRWRWLYRWLRNTHHQAKTHHALLEALSPALARCYAPYQIPTDNSTPGNRFDAFCKKHTNYEVEDVSAEEQHPFLKSTPTNMACQSTKAYSDEHRTKTLLSHHDVRQHQALRSLTLATGSQVPPPPTVNKSKKQAMVHCKPKDAQGLLKQAIAIFQHEDRLMQLWVEKKYDGFIEKLQAISYAHELKERLMSRIDAGPLTAEQQLRLLQTLVDNQFSRLILRGFILENDKSFALINKILNAQRSLVRIELLYCHMNNKNHQASKFLSQLIRGQLTPTVQHIHISSLANTPDDLPFMLFDKSLSKKSREKEYERRFKKTALTTLTLSHIPSLVFIGNTETPFYLPHLKRLTLHHSGCQRLMIASPTLEHVDVKHNKDLIHLTLDSHHLVSLDLRYCENLTDEALIVALKAHYKITRVSLDGCNSISDFFIDLSQDALLLLTTIHAPHLLEMNEIKKRLDINFKPNEGAEIITHEISDCLQNATTKNNNAFYVAALLHKNKQLTSFQPIINWNEGLHINDNGATALSEALKTNTTLTSLDLSSNNIGEGGIIALSEALKINTILTSLDLSLNKTGERGATALSEALKINTTLTSLNLQRNDIGEGGIIALSKALKINTTLTSLNLEYNNIGNAGAVALRDALKINASLTSLDLSDNYINVARAAALSKALKINTTLTSLNLRSNSIGEAGAAALSKALKINASLTKLNLGYNNIGAAGTGALSEALTINTTLTSLDLGWNRIGDASAGAAALSEALKINTTLTSLNLGWNRIGAAGAAALSEALKINTSLTSLDLYSNNIGEAGAAALSEVLKINTSLTSLDLSSNEIGAAAAAALSEALKINTSLTSLDLGYNNIDDAGTGALSEALKINTSLTSLDLGWNQIDASGAAALSEVLDKNKSLLYLNIGNYRISDETNNIVENHIEASIQLAHQTIDAIAKNDSKTALELLCRGVSPYATDGAYKENGDIGSNVILHTIAQQGNIKLMQYLFDKYSTLNLNFKNKAEKTPLDIAIEAKQVAMVEFLQAMSRNKQKSSPITHPHQTRYSFSPQPSIAQQQQTPHSSSSSSSPDEPPKIPFDFMKSM